MKRTQSILGVIITLLAPPALASGQSVAGPADAAENIVVASQKSADELRRDLWKAERDFYSIYNKLNDDSRYDVRCTREAPTGSVLKTQSCRPKFLDRALREGRISNRENLDANSEINSKMATFRETLETLVGENEDLQAAAAKLNQAYALLEAEGENR